jgi:hypothetical protein
MPFNVLQEYGAGETPQALAPRRRKSGSALSSPLALEGLALKSLFDFIVRTEATRGARRCS